jgi:MOSC domain-containing protein YiiM
MHALPLNPNSPLAALMAAPIRPGTVTWIGLRTARRAPMEEVAKADLLPDIGVVGDRYSGRPGGKRQVTLIQAEDLAAIAAALGRESVSPLDMRRNVVVAGLNLNALKDRRFRLGSAELEATGDCHPCSRMEESLGTGGYNAVRGRGGLTARVLTGGVVRIGDVIRPLSD